MSYPGIPSTDGDPDELFLLNTFRENPLRLNIFSIYLRRMVNYITRILKFDKKGEKTGWTYIEVPADVAGKLKKGNKKGFHVKGKLDAHLIKRASLLPMGEGKFILPLNAAIRKAIGKRHGAMLKVALEEDKSEFVFNADFIACLEDEPAALKHFKTLPGSHQRYFSKWIDSAKTDATKAKRIAQAVNGLMKGMGFPEMMRSLKNIH